MSKLNDLADFLCKKVFDDIEDYWKESETYATIELVADGDSYAVEIITDIKMDGRKIAANNARGIYMWTHNDKTIYIGKTDSPTMSIHKRQKNHFRSFEKPLEQSESSGRKYREFMKENDLQRMRIDIKYINTAEFNIEGMAELIETATIKRNQPLLNREIKGRGSRK